jgi:F420-dependent oxidoreductase-like protein
MPGRRPRFGLKVTQMNGTYAEIRDAWLEADRLGFDTGWAHDHLLNLHDPARPEDEGWTILTALLVEARRIRGGLMVTANTFRHPAVLAKIATTVDVVSAGRLEVGLGAGWFEEEHRQYGLRLPPLGERMQRLDETCRVLKALWTEPRATFEGVHYQIREAFHEPKPVQRPHPPLVIGTSGERVGLRIVARHAQEWNMAMGTAAEFRRLSALLDGYCREAERDPSAVERSIQFLPEAMQGSAADLGGAGPRVRRRRGDPPHLELPPALQCGRRPLALERGRDPAPGLSGNSVLRGRSCSSGSGRSARMRRPVERAAAAWAGATGRRTAGTRRSPRWRRDSPPLKPGSP